MADNDKKSVPKIPVVFLESPYSGDIDANVQYALACATHSYMVKGECPIALHLLLTKLPHGEFVPDDTPLLKGREHGLQCCRETRKRCDKVVFYVDRGWSSGMLRAFDECRQDGIEFEFRKLQPSEENKVMMIKACAIFSQEINQEHPNYQTVRITGIREDGTKCKHAFTIPFEHKLEDNRAEFMRVYCNAINRFVTEFCVKFENGPHLGELICIPSVFGV